MNELASDGTNPGGILGFHLQFQQVLKIQTIQIRLGMNPKLLNLELPKNSKN